MRLNKLFEIEDDDELDKKLDEKTRKKIAKLFPSAWKKAPPKLHADVKKEYGGSDLATDIDPDDIMYQAGDLLVVTAPANPPEDMDDDDMDVAVHVEFENGVLTVIDWRIMT
jgi:hypothetical protein